MLQKVASYKLRHGREYRAEEEDKKRSTDIKLMYKEQDKGHGDTVDRYPGTLKKAAIYKLAVLVYHHAPDALIEPPDYAIDDKAFKKISDLSHAVKP